MIVVGLTGKIGAGKSTVASLFADRGATVIDADRIAHEVLREPEVAGLVVGRFGQGVVAADGSIDRQRLAKRVFGPTEAHAADLEALEAMIHPRVATRIAARLDALSSPPLEAVGPDVSSPPLEAVGPDVSSPPLEAVGPRVVIMDVPLLAKSGLLGRCTDVLEVVCDEQVRRARLSARGWTPAEIEARDAAWDRGGPLSRGGQASNARPAAEFLDNSGEVRYTSGEVDRVLRDFVARWRARGT